MPLTIGLFAANPDEFTFGWYTSGRFELNVQGSFTESDWYSQSEWDKWWIGWNRHCLTWEINDYIKVKFDYIKVNKSSDM